MSLDKKHDVIVSFTNGETKRFHDCDKYIVYKDYDCFFIYKNSNGIMLPTKNVNFITYADDISEML